MVRCLPADWGCSRPVAKGEVGRSEGQALPTAEGVCTVTGSRSLSVVTFGNFRYLQ